MKLMYITSDPQIAVAAEQAGVDWIFVDLEILGKEDRQGHLDTVISRHTVDDVRAMRAILSTSQLLVRVNPINANSRVEIDQVIRAGADIVMLPYFVTAGEVREFISTVDGRARTCLLLETPQAVEALEEIISVPGIDYVHIGLNDLHLGYDLDFMFEPLINGTVDHIAAALRAAGVPFGFGGVARLGDGTLPAQRILGEHRRLGSNMVILSRAFLDMSRSSERSHIGGVFRQEVGRIRDYEAYLERQPDSFFTANKAATARGVAEIVQGIRAKAQGRSPSVPRTPNPPAAQTEGQLSRSS